MSRGWCLLATVLAAVNPVAPALKVLCREDLHVSGTEVFHLGKISLSLLLECSKKNAK